MDQLKNVKEHRNRTVCLVRNVMLKRALHNVDPEPKLNFWRITYGNLMDVAVIEWCKTFGSDSEGGHWKEVVDNHDSFRSGLLDQLGISQDRWAEYWKEMKRYRDKRAAHADFSVEVPDFPCFDIALKSAYYYYQFLIELKPELVAGGEPTDLRSYASDFEALAKKAAQAAIKATDRLPETVY